jgi:hypothetical protein
VEERGRANCLAQCQELAAFLRVAESPRDAFQISHGADLLDIDAYFLGSRYGARGHRARMRKVELQRRTLQGRLSTVAEGEFEAGGAAFRYRPSSVRNQP